MSAGRDSRIWVAGVVALAAPFLALLCLTLWRTPYPLSEGVALLEDVARNPAARFLSPDTSYYRPFFHITLSTIWHNAGSLEAAIGWIKLLQIVPVLLLVTLFLVMARPRSAVDAGASLVALAVLTGSPSFRDNLEIPLSYTTVGMPAALAVWLLLERPWRRWHGVAILALTALAVGFKEQGLVIVPVVAAAWWAGAPGVRRGTALVLVTLAAVYVGVRLSASGAWPLFQQDIGYGFTRLSTEAAEQRFGAFPLWIFAYNALSTIANVLFAEPTAGVFRITDAIVQGRWSVQDVVALTSSMTTTGLIVWWASGAVRRALTSGWTPDARLVAVTVVALAACGALSFNYSRDRLGGMAIVFYAVTAWCALRAAALRAVGASRGLFPISIAGLLLLAGAWQVRQLETLEIARDTAGKNVREWLTDLPERRLEFRDRETYLRIMESGIAQGTDLSVTEPTRYRRLAAWIVGRR